jgi:hypothetical protein
MNESWIIIDKIENGLAVCEAGGGLLEIPLAQISGVAREGDILREAENGIGYTIDKEETELRRAMILKRFERIKAKNR